MMDNCQKRTWCFGLIHLSLLFWCCLPMFCQAQENRLDSNWTSQQLDGNLAIELAWKRGAIFKHTTDFLPEITMPSHLFQMNLIKKTAGEKQWHAYYAYPELGLSLVYAHYGDKAIFGRGYGLLPSLRLLTRTRHIHIHYHLGIGLAYISKPFDSFNNPTNNVIGSHWNNITMLMLGLEYAINTKWSCLATFSFTHFSNGKIQLPNLGINIPTLGANLRYNLTKKTKIEGILKESLPKWERKAVGLGFRLSYAFLEDGKPGGPLFPMYGGNLYLTKRANRFGQWHLGLEGNYYTFIHHFILNQAANEGRLIGALKLAPYMAYEFLFGRIGGLLGLGVYAYNPFLPKAPFFFKVGMQSYLKPTYERLGKNLFVGVYLKAHYFKADYVELGLGWLF